MIRELLEYAPAGSANKRRGGRGDYVPYSQYTICIYDGTSPYDSRYLLLEQGHEADQEKEGRNDDTNDKRRRILTSMVTPPRFVNSADAEAYRKACESLICDYCGRQYSRRRPLNEPIEVYSSNRTVKRWIVICKLCAHMIKDYERKRNRTRKQTESIFSSCDDPLYLRKQEEEKEPQPDHEQMIG